jgi:hypothetical protein
VTEVAIVAVPVVFPRATRTDRGAAAPVKPAKPTFTAAGALQLSVTFAVAGAPPGTDAGDRVSPLSAGWHVAAPAGVCGTNTMAAATSTRAKAMRFMLMLPARRHLAGILYLGSQ